MGTGLGKSPKDLMRTNLPKAPSTPSALASQDCAGGNASRLVDRLALTIPEAATALGISERHLRSMLPELPHCRIGGRVVLPVEPLRDWLARRAHAEQEGADQVAREIVKSLADNR